MIAICAALSLSVLIVLTIPIRNPSGVVIYSQQERIDERDAIFHRFLRLQPGTKDFKTYYKDNPDKKNIDALIRDLPELGYPGSLSYHPISSVYQTALFDVIEDFTRDVEDQPDPLENRPIQASPEEWTRRVKGFSRYLGADLVGTTRLNPAYVYSHVGRSPGIWGAPIHLDHE